MADRRRNVGIPSGAVFQFAGTVAPYGYLLCDGSAISRSDYADLFLAIGNAHGSGDGSTTFNLPDYRGRFLRGVDGSAGRDADKASRTAMTSGGNTGNAVGSVQDDSMQGHRHSYDTQRAQSQYNNTAINIEWGGAGWNVGVTNSGAVREPSTDGVNGTPRTSSETRGKNANVNFIIKI